MSSTKRYSRRLPAVLLLLLVLMPPTVGAQERVPPDAVALLQKLGGGGYNLYFRHAETNWSQSDDVQKAGDWRSCDGRRMRQLSAEGRATSAGIGEAMRALRLPVQRVLTSPYCRCVQTAQLLQVGPVVKTSAVINMRAAGYFGGRETVAGTAREVLGTVPPPGTNTVIVAHGNVAIATFGFRPAEGEAVVLQPRGDGEFAVRGRLTPEAFELLAARVSP